MDVCWISFVLDDNGDDDDYNERWHALDDAVRGLADLVWDQTTSFYMARTRLDYWVVADKLSAAVDVSRDVVVVGSMNFKGIATVGPTRAPLTLRALTGGNVSKR